MADAPPPASSEAPAEKATVGTGSEGASPSVSASPLAEVPAAVEESLPLREDFIQNAVKFLSHPKVQGSPVQYRRSFLEKKGLNNAEITEAFRRVPDTVAAPSATVPATTTVTTTTTAPAPATAPAGTLPRSSAVPRKPWEQNPPPASATQALASAQPQSVAPPVAPRQGVRWTQMVLALGVLSAAGAGTVLVTKDYLVPRLKVWLRCWLLDLSEEAGGVRKLTPVEEATNAASAAASAAAEATQIMKETRETLKGASEEGDRKLDAILGAFQRQTRELTTTLDGLKATLDEREASRKEAVILGTAGHPEGAPPVSLADLRKELLKFTSVVTGFSGTPPIGKASAIPGLALVDSPGLAAPVQEHRASTQSLLSPPADEADTVVEDGLNWLQSPEAPSPSMSVTGPAPKGPLLVPIDRRALGTSGGGHAAPAYQGLSMQPTSAAMESRVGTSNSWQQTGPPLASAVSGPSSVDKTVQGADHAPHSKSYMDVLQMIKDGKPIPGIRDIDDKPPNPNQAPSGPKLKPRAKPWEKGFQQVSETPGVGPSPPPFDITNSRTMPSSAPVYASNGQAPWWRAQPLSQPGANGAQPGLRGGSMNASDSEGFVHPALAGDIEPAKPAPQASELAAAGALSGSTPSGRFTELPSQPSGAHAGVQQPGLSGSSEGASGASGAQEVRTEAGGSASVVPQKPAWRPPAVPGYSMASAADAIKGKGKVVPVTPMAPTAQQRGGQGSGVGPQEQKGEEGQISRTDGNAADANEAGTSNAEVREPVASSQEGDSGEQLVNGD